MNASPNNKRNFVREDLHIKTFMILIYNLMHHYTAARFIKFSRFFKILPTKPSSYVVIVD